MAQVRDVVVKRREVLRKAIVSPRVKDFRDKASERVFVWEIRQSPAGMNLGFARSFYGVGLQPLTGRGALFGVEWPHANERLIQECFFVAVRHGAAPESLFCGRHSA